jgi:hypothetical protein
MNESQYNYNQDIHHKDYTSEQNLSPEITADYNQDSLTSFTHTEESWEQDNQTDYTQPNFNGTEEYNSFSANEMEIQSNSYGSDLSDLNNSYYDNQHLSSNNYEQNNYGVEQNYYENTLDTQNYNNNLWEQQFQQHNSPAYADMSFQEQRSGHAPTADDLNKALDLEHQAQEEERMSQYDTNWARMSEDNNLPHEAHLSHGSAAEHKQKAEDLQAEANRLRDQT